MKKHLYILVAYEDEAKLLLRALDSDLSPVFVQSRQTFTCADEHFQWNIFVSGMGKVQAASACQMILDLHHVDRLYEFGIAGGLVESLNVGDLVIVSDVYEYDAPNREEVLKAKMMLKRRLFETCSADIARFSQLLRVDPSIQAVRGAVACGDQDIFSRAFRDQIAEQSGAVAVDWETEAIVEVCAMNYIPYLGTRIVADKATEEGAGPIPPSVWAILDKVTFAYVRAIRSFEQGLA